jgi:F-type H+-transporting ATPase subunit epsilon
MENAAEDKKVRMRVVTPSRVIYDKLVDMVIARTTVGDMGVLHGHDTAYALLNDGLLRIVVDKDKKKEELLVVLQGSMSVRNNEVVILTELADDPNVIHETISNMRKERALVKVKEQMDDLYLESREIAIRRTLVQREGSTYPIMRGK